MRMGSLNRLSWEESLTTKRERCCIIGYWLLRQPTNAINITYAGLQVFVDKFLGALLVHSSLTMPVHRMTGKIKDTHSNYCYWVQVSQNSHTKKYQVHHSRPHSLTIITSTLFMTQPIQFPIQACLFVLS